MVKICGESINSVAILLIFQDFRNFTYSLPIIRGMMIHMEDKLTTVLIPQNSYPQIQKALEMSNTPVLALGGNFRLVFSPQIFLKILNKRIEKKFRRVSNIWTSLALWQLVVNFSFEPVKNLSNFVFLKLENLLPILPYFALKRWSSNYIKPRTFWKKIFLKSNIRS